MPTLSAAWLTACAKRVLGRANVLMDGLADRGESGGFGEAEDGAADHQAGKTAGEAGGDAGARTTPPPRA